MGRRWISAPPQPEPLLREPKKIETSVNGEGGGEVVTGNKRLTVLGNFFDMQKKWRRGEE